MQQKRSFTIEEAKKKLEHYCTYQERCHQEVVRKLRNMGIISIAIDQIVSHLITENYLNETRFSQRYASGKFRIKKWGKLRIVRELKARKISPINIKLALKEISHGEYLDTLYSLAQKFWQSNAKYNITKRKKKLIDALRYRGWESELIFEVLNNLETEIKP